MGKSYDNIATFEKNYIVRNQLKIFFTFKYNVTNC